MTTDNFDFRRVLDHIKAHLLDSINDIVSTTNQFVLHPEKDFSRKSQLTMKTMIQAILTMGGNTLAKELLDLDLPVSQSALTPLVLMKNLT